MSRKPSRAAVRTLLILSYIEASIIVVKDNHSNPIIAEAVVQSILAADRAIKMWKFTGDNHNLDKEVLLKMGQISAKIEQIWWYKAQPIVNFPCMCYTGMQLLDDLMVLITDERRKAALQEIFDCLTILVDHVDPEGKMFLTQDRAKELTDTIYSVIGER